MEILSPASNMQHIQVAIDHNANAVYGGLTKWNARNKAINFTTDQYNLLIKELHKNNIKFFLTLNILMLDEEIEDVIEFLKNNLLPDSFIVTDMGLIKRLSEEFPQVPLHFSTQFGCHNIDDVNYVESLGGTRSILARELTLEEINLIKKNTNIELECFTWGSQCISFSGLCFFGTIINGGGGNRGKCMITCRDIYSVNNEKGHYMYVPDMDITNIVRKLKDIDCLKIEGRRRNPVEIAYVLDKINLNINSNTGKGYIFGESILQNGLYEKINSRIKPIMCAKDTKNIDADDVCVEFTNSIPIRFSNDYQNEKVMYIGTEIKKLYNVELKNISLDLLFDNEYLKEVLYVNSNGTGHTFFEEDDGKRKFDIKLLIKEIESKNANINIYITRYKKNKNNSYYISDNMYKK
ncbi:MAG: peptidase U32 family protein, partial [Bacilli bacterium]